MPAWSEPKNDYLIPLLTHMTVVRHGWHNYRFYQRHREALDRVGLRYPAWLPLTLTLLRIGKELGIEPDVILATSHGRRSIDVLEVLDPSKANWDCRLNCANLLLGRYD